MHLIDFIAPIVMRQPLQVQEIRELNFRLHGAKLGYRLDSPHLERVELDHPRSAVVAQ
jgi:hypothetical protein